MLPCLLLPAVTSPHRHPNTRPAVLLPAYASYSEPSTRRILPHAVNCATIIALHVTKLCRFIPETQLHFPRIPPIPDTYNDGESTSEMNTL